MMSRAASYFDTLHASLAATECSGADNDPIGLDEAVERVVHLAREAHEAGNKIMFIGNGGSAGIASHMAIDFSKNGGLRAVAFNDGAALTCLGNDLGYENVFAKQLELHARPGDLLIAISSSGRSANILNAVAVARARNCPVVTLSGFDAANPLRPQGTVNFYVPSGAYGFVEISHLSLCHGILDIAMGWDGAAASA